MGGVVEVDETYVGGKVKNMHKSQKTKPFDPMANKFAVFGLLAHDGRVVAFPVARTDVDTLQQAVLDHVSKGLRFTPTATRPTPC